MNHERLAALILAQKEAMAAHPKARTVRENILGVLHALDVGEITQAQALRLLGYQAVQADDPFHTALYRQAAAAVRAMPREEH